MSTLKKEKKGEKVKFLIFSPTKEDIKMPSIEEMLDELEFFKENPFPFGGRVEERTLLLPRDIKDRKQLLERIADDIVGAGDKCLCTCIAFKDGVALFAVPPRHNAAVRKFRQYAELPHEMRVLARRKLHPKFVKKALEV